MRVGNLQIHTMTTRDEGRHDNEPGKRPATTRTDLGIIIVISNRYRDLVFLTHNQLKIFSLSCPPGKPSVFTFNEKFYLFDENQWVEVFMAYFRWKRKSRPGFKLPTHSGRRADGKTHPWRWHPPTKKKRGES